MKNFNKKVLVLLAIAVVFSYFGWLNSLSAQIQYTPLTPLPGSPPGQPITVSTYIPTIFTLAIGIAGVLAVLMIVIGGIEMLSTDSVFKQEEGKKKIQNAITGLLLAIGAFIILNTINPKILVFDLNQIKPQRPPTIIAPGTPGTPSGANDYYDMCINAPGATPDPVPCACLSCVDLTSMGIPLKAGANNLVVDWFAQGLDDLNQRLINLGNSGGRTIVWEVTEAWKPTVAHRNGCHRSGTCVDAAIRNLPQGSIGSQALYINDFIRQARLAGMSPQFEVSTQAEEQALEAAGVAPNDVIVVPGVLPHFSIY